MLGLIDRPTKIDALLRGFHRQGYARSGSILGDPRLHALRARATAMMTGPAPYPGLFYQHDSPTGRYDDLTYVKGWIGPSTAYRKLEGLQADATFREWIENPRVGGSIPPLATNAFSATRK
jgi:hypothetical protein